VGEFTRPGWPNAGFLKAAPNIPRESRPPRWLYLQQWTCNRILQWRYHSPSCDMWAVTCVTLEDVGQAASGPVSQTRRSGWPDGYERRLLTVRLFALAAMVLALPMVGGNRTWRSCVI